MVDMFRLKEKDTKENVYILTYEQLNPWKPN